jgi:hypothetical protein
VCARRVSLRRGNRRRTRVRTWLLTSLAAALVVGFLDSGQGSPPARAASGADTPADIELAIDGTGSMASAVARAKSEGARAVSGISSLLPESRFAVVVFRDHGNPAGEYQLLQPLTSDAAKVQDQLNRVTTHSNPTPGNGPAESYNLAFHNSYSDPRIGWRPSARKIVVVLGDAEPNGAGSDGLSGCHDNSVDPEGLSTPRELANMRAANLTLIMIRELSAQVSVSLQCYGSIAAGAYVGGAARDASGDLAPLIVELVQGAYAPVTVRNDLGVALRNARTGFTITVRNPNPLALKLKSLAFEVPPSGFAYLSSSITSPRAAASGRTFSWALNMSVPPNQLIAFHVILRTPAHTGTYRSRVSTQFETSAGNELDSRPPAALFAVKRRISAVGLLFRRTATAGSALTGSVRARFGRWKGLPAVGPAQGRLTLRRGKATVLLRAAGLRLASLAVPTRTRVRLRVVASAGYRRCRVGAGARLLVTDSNNSQDGRSTKLELSLPTGCGGRVRPRATLAFSAR